jgi:primosomal protein N' (replication factor Y) (superfamily II helicase)
MKYAEVAVNSPFSGSRSYCYSIPPQLNIDIGFPVWVPFGPRTLQGIVIDITDIPSFTETREIEDIISTKPMLSPQQIELAKWLSDYYLAPLFDCISLMLPPGFERRIKVCYTLSSVPSDLNSLPPEQKAVIDIFSDNNEIRLRQLEKKLGKVRAARIARDMTIAGMLTRHEELTGSGVKPKKVRVVEPDILPENVTGVLEGLKAKKKGKQAAVLEYLLKQEHPVTVQAIREELNTGTAVITSLQKAGLVNISEVEIRRDPLARYDIVLRRSPQLTPGQENVWRVLDSHLNGEKKQNKAGVFLLQGVTGSGKTEIYLRALEKVLSQGKKGICLVPEIALTPQTIERFVSRFPGRVAVYHSELSPGEQFDEWRRIANGECDVVIGPRSALFCPQPELGLIVLDEEHEWTYKQSDKSPRYHARTVAVKMAELTGATVILGSATPDVESCYRAESGDYRLISLQERITGRGITPLPEVEIVNLRDELMAGNTGIFSRSLLRAMAEVLNNKEQAILYLNRRGTANFMRCLNCGSVMKCPRCLVALTYHAESGKLVCHHCKYSCLPPRSCPVCHRPRMSMFGVGTQKVAGEALKFFPKARIVRWDRDVTGKKGSHEEIMEKLVKREVDVLVGTQMIAKGLDLPGITLAGVINADTGINLPDFRAGERTFQLTSQIAGRAGRGLVPGRVIIQTYSPEHYAIRAAAKHDYSAFYRTEIEYRKSLGYPPFSQMAGLTFSHINSAICSRDANRVLKMLTDEKDKQGITGLRIIGPVPAFIPRVRGHYRWHMVIIGHNLPQFLAKIELPKSVIIDIDPMSMF